MELAPTCRYCTGPNTELSTGGPDVCVMCELYGVEPAVWMGKRKPYDFHAMRRAPVETLCAHCDHPGICHDMGGTFSRGECMLHLNEDCPCPCPGFTATVAP